MKRKNVFVMVLAIMLLLITRCGSEGRVQNQAEEQTVEVRKEWNVTHGMLPEEYEVATIDEENIYACRIGKDGMQIFVFDKDTLTQINCYEIAGALEIKSITINAEEEICVFGSTKEGQSLWKVSSDGAVTEIEDIVVEDLGKTPQITDFYADDKGYYYLCYNMRIPYSEIYGGEESNLYLWLDRIYVKDSEMNTILYEQVETLVSFSFNEAGMPTLLARDEEGYYLQRVRTEQREAYEQERLDESVVDALDVARGYGSMVTAFTENGLLYTSDGTLHLYDVENQEDEKLLELAGAGIFAEDIIYMGMKGDTIEIIDNYIGMEQTEYTKIEEGESERTTVTFGTMMLGRELKETITLFNRFQNEVMLEPIVYWEDGWSDYEACEERLLLDLISGKGPDILDADSVDVELLASRGAFTDLYTFMEKDTELRKADLVESILNIYETEGHLYSIAPEFRLYTIWGAESVVKGRSGINLEEMEKLLAENGGDVNSIYGFSEDETVLTALCYLQMDKFINWDESTCDFTGDAFKQVLRFSKEYKGTPYDSLYEAIQEKELLLYLGVINSAEEYQLHSKIFGEPIEFVGYPTESGSGSAAILGNELAINSQSEHQEEAWEFVKFFVQNGYYGGSGFPLLKEQFEEVLEESKKPRLELNEEGKEEPVAKQAYSEQHIGSILVFQCAEEDVEAIRKLVDSVTDKARYHTELQEIIEEEAESYFSGQKDIEQVCEIIQSRVEVYLNERK